MVHVTEEFYVLILTFHLSSLPGWPYTGIRSGMVRAPAATRAASLYYT